MRSTRPPEHEVLVVGAGPYGLSVTAHLRDAGTDTHVVGDPMVFWRENMPRGMLLRSAWEASHIDDPRGELTLDHFAADRGRPIPQPIPLEDFVDYGRWFQERVAPDLDRRAVRLIERAGDGFRVTFDYGDELSAERVVVATGLKEFPARPPEFDGLDRSLVSHSSEHADLGSFADRRVLVIGGGQSALESAALLREAGAEVDAVFVRARVIHWLPPKRLDGRRSRLHRILYPPTDVGPPGLNWVIALPRVFKALPEPWQEPTARRCIRPAGADWLRPRLAGVALETRTAVASVEAANDGVAVRLADGRKRTADHVLLATGYRIRLDGYTILAPELKAAVRQAAGYPVLDRGSESSVRGLHFVGAPAAPSISPIMRFVTGTGHSGRGVARAAAGAAAHRRARRMPTRLRRLEPTRHR